MIFVDTGFFFALRPVNFSRPLQEAFAYLKQHGDKRYSAVDCLSFVVMLRLRIREAWTFDAHFSHRFIVRPGQPTIR